MDTNVCICVCMTHLHMYVLVHLFIGMHGGQRSDALPHCFSPYFLKIQSLTECGISTEPESSSNPLFLPQQQWSCKYML